GVIYFYYFFFFFQAEDGIRDRNVTGVQTCALPILADQQIRDFVVLYLAEGSRKTGKDLIKESLFDTLGVGDREWSRKLGRATIELLFVLMESELAAGRSFLVECNFSTEHATPRFVELKEKYGFEPFQVVCRTEEAVLME